MENLESMQAFVQLLEQSHKIVFFGGAGVSTESGIPDFRSADGLYNKKLNIHFSPEELVSHSFFMEHPQEFFDFYREQLLYPDAVPNACHRALAQLEKQGRLLAVITQNIDGLHQKAGSKCVLELHGSVLRNYCMKCHKAYGMETILQAKGIPLCTCGGRIKPDVVLYEESLDSSILEQAIEAIASADLLIIGGTSLVVYPAAGLIRYFHGQHIVLINKSVTQADQSASLLFHESLGKIMGTALELMA